MTSLLLRQEDKGEKYCIYIFLKPCLRVDLAMSSAEEKDLKAGHPPAGSSNRFVSVTIEMNAAYASFCRVQICQQKLQMVAIVDEMAMFSHVLDEIFQT